jgi:hypothetical protein
MPSLTAILWIAAPYSGDSQGRRILIHVCWKGPSAHAEPNVRTAASRPTPKSLDQSSGSNLFENV